MSSTYYQGLVETAEYYIWNKFDNPELVWSDSQREQIEETIDGLRRCGYMAGGWWADELEKYYKN